MKNEMITIRLKPQEKKALKLQALEADQTLTDYILGVLRNHTNLPARSVSLAKSIPSTQQIVATGGRND